MQTNENTSPEFIIVSEGQVIEKSLPSPPCRTCDRKNPRNSEFIYVAELIHPKPPLSSTFHWAEALQRFCRRFEGVVALVSVSEWIRDEVPYLVLGGPSHVDTTYISLGARSENVWSMGNIHIFLNKLSPQIRSDFREVGLLSTVRSHFKIIRAKHQSICTLCWTTVVWGKTE